MGKSKKAVIAMIVCLLLCGCTLWACNKPSEGDNASKNVAFTAYRQKVTAILRDHGIHVNDVDGTQTNDKKNAGAAYGGARAADGNQTIADAVAADSGKKPDVQSIHNMRDDLFEQTLFVSLYMGDALLNDFGQKDIYGVAVQYGRQYFMLAQKEGKDYVCIYSPDFYAGQDFYMTMCIDYRSASEYSYTFVQYTEDMTEAVYAHGTAQKQFYAVSASTAYAEGNYLYHAASEDDGYSSRLNIASCLESVRSHFTAFSVSDIRAVGTARYELTEEQWQRLNEKYFGQSGDKETVEKGWQFAKVGSVRVAYLYMADGEKTVEIPADCEYVAAEMIVEDEKGAVEELIIPRSVKGVARTHDPVTGEPYTELHAVPASQWILQFRSRAPQGNARALPSVTVHEGSPLFRAGRGHLYTADGALVYLADCPLSSLDLGEYTDDALNDLVYAVREGEYSKLFSQISRLEITLQDLRRNVLFEDLFACLPALRQLTIGGNALQEGDVPSLPVTVFGDLTVTINVVTRQKSGLPDIRFVLDEPHTVNVLVPYVCPVPQIAGADGHVTVQVGIPQDLYEQLFGQVYGGVRVQYASGSLTEQQKQAFAFSVHERSGAPELAAVLQNGDFGASVDVPRAYGLHVTALAVKEAPAAVEIVLHDGIRWLVFEEQTEGLVLRYDGTVEQFENNVRIVCYGSMYSFVLRHADGEKTYTGGFTAPAEELCTITLVYTDAQNAEQRITVPNVRKGVLYETHDLEREISADGSRLYAWSGDDGSVHIFNNSLYPDGDTVYTAVKIRDYRQSFTLTHNDFTVSMEYYWGSDTVEIQSAFYRGANLFVGDNRWDSVVLVSEDKENYFEIQPVFAYAIDNNGYLTVAIADLILRT